MSPKDSLGTNSDGILTILRTASFIPSCRKFHLSLVVDNSIRNHVEKHLLYLKKQFLLCTFIIMYWSDSVVIF
jgi:hypothetical protein